MIVSDGGGAVTVNVYGENISKDKTSSSYKVYTTTLKASSCVYYFKWQVDVTVDNDGTRSFTCKLGIKKSNDGVIVINTPFIKNISSLSCDGSIVNAIKSIGHTDDVYYWEDIPTNSFKTIWSSSAKKIKADSSASYTPTISFELYKYEVGSPDTYKISLSCATFSFKQTKFKVTFAYDEDDVTITSVGSCDNSSKGKLIANVSKNSSANVSITAPSFTKDDDEREGTYVVRWLYKDGVHSDYQEFSSEEKDWKDKKHYTGFKWNYSGIKTVSSGGSVAVSSSITFNAIYTKPNDWTKVTKPTIGASPGNPERQGYTFKGWFMDEGHTTTVSSSKVIDSDVNIYAYFIPNIYNVVFDLSSIDRAYDSNGKKILASAQKIASKKKTYDSPLDLTDVKIPVRNGYVFAGWYCDDESVVYTTTLNHDYSDTQGDTITLYPKWEYTYNYVDYKYYTVKKVSGVTSYEANTDVLKYNIDEYDGSVYKDSPDKETYEDFAFVGWCTEKPTGWDEHHGIYIDLDSVDKPYTFEDVIKFDPEQPWTADVRSTRWGIYTFSARYIKIGGQWRKSPLSYIKINGHWRKVDTLWIKKNGHWQQEVTDV